ncbi:MAG TPA: arsenical pump-driving ATPase [Gemmatimonadaceae bacterium]
MTPFLFFTGKGGVGKTSVACATAVQLAEGGSRTLVVSTDPASNLDDVFGLELGPAPLPIPGVPRLWAMNLDPEQAAATYRETMVAPYRGVLPASAIRSMEEQFSGACTVEIAAFNEFTTLLADPAAVADFDHVIFDTAPTGHTLRLLTLPSAWTGFIDTNTTGTSCLGPLAGLEKHRAQYGEAVAALADPARTTLILVSRPETSALREAARASSELRAMGIANQELVVNGVLGDSRGDAVAAAFVERQHLALAGMPAELAPLPRRDVPLVAWDLTGAPALRDFARASDVTASAPASALATSPVAAPAPTSMRCAAPSTPAASEDSLGAIPDLTALVAELGAAQRGVVMTMGKGGVGKTTLAVNIALALARAGYRVHLTTTDPAAHVAASVTDAGGEQPKSLSVSRIDPDAETVRYTEEVLASAGEMSSADRALLEEDLRSPCTEEIAVFRAFARVVDEGQDGFVVLDTAPTGHTLLLLDAAESYHREVARTAGSASIPDAVRSLLPRLRDPAYTRMLLVTHAESTPVHEAERLQADLRRAGIEPYGWVVNASLAASGTAHPLLSQRAALERPWIARVRALSGRVWLIPWHA